MILKLISIVVIGVVMQQSGAGAKTNKHVICYHGTWSTYRHSLGKYDVTDIDPFLCTHLVYAFLGIHESGELRVIDPYLDLEDNWGRGNIKKFNALKLQNPTLKTLAAVGGWNEGSKKFSIVAADPEKRARFVKSTVQFLQKHGFDGLDLDWEYPNQRHNLNNDDRSNYVTLLGDLKEGLDPFGYLLTAAVGSAEYSASLSYNIPKISKYLDLINVMSYDLHGSWDDVLGINAPLHAGPSDISALDKQLNIDSILKYWLDQGAPRQKLIVGVPFYGRSYTLQNTEKTTPGSPHLGRGLAGQYSVEPGVIGYNELCEKMLREQWTVEWEASQMVPYAHRDRQWVGYETPQSLALKAQYVLDNDLAGIMVWSLESDDFHGICGEERYPLLKQINRVLYGSTATGLTQAANYTNSFSTPSNRDEFKCQTESGYVRDPKDCSKFFFCEAGVTYKFDCPHSLKFDLNSMSCNYAHLVKC